MQPFRLVAFAVVGLCVTVSALLWSDGTASTPTQVPTEVKAIGLLEGPSPFELGPVDGSEVPLLTTADVDDAVGAYVTDPFVVRDGERWLMFLSVRREASDLGAIAIATSSDTRSWTYEGLVLATDIHMSYPQVFEHDGEWFMTVESAATRQVRLYRAETFPTSWVFDSVLLSERNYTDPTIFEHEGRWWMFVSRRPRINDIVELFVADDPRGPWAQHPASPIVDGDRNIARPGGPVIRDGDRLFRVAQDADPTYGNGLWAFEITTLTPTAYEEQRVGDAQILGIGSAPWTDIGLGHLSVVETSPGTWTGFITGEGVVALP